MTVRRLPMFPLGTVLFPEAILPLHVFEERYRTMMEVVLAERPAVFGVVLIERGSEVGGGDVRSDVGTLAVVEGATRAPDGRYALVTRGVARLRVEQWLPDDPYPQAVVEILGGEDGGGDAGEADLAAAAGAVRRMEALYSELGARPLPTPESDSVWGLCQRLPVNPLDRQRLLATDDPAVRLALVRELADALADDALRMLQEG